MGYLCHGQCWVTMRSDSNISIGVNIVHKYIIYRCL